MKKPILLGLHASPPRWLAIVLAILPFALVVVGYLVASDIKLAENPSYKLLPSPASMYDAIVTNAFTVDVRSGNYLWWSDTLASLTRLLMGVGLAAACGFLLGLNMGMFKSLSATFSMFLTVIAMIPPLAILPILFITFGVGEVGKVVLIFIGTFPVIARDIYLSTKKIPGEQIVKALTLGGSSMSIVYRVIAPQLLPRLITVVRLALGAAWLFLIAAEAISSQDGLGYRIFLVRRYQAMDLILPLVAWITFMGFMMDYGLRKLQSKAFPYYRDSRSEG